MVFQIAATTPMGLWAVIYTALRTTPKNKIILYSKCFIAGVTNKRPTRCFLRPSTWFHISEKTDVIIV